VKRAGAAKEKPPEGGFLSWRTPGSVYCLGASFFFAASVAALAASSADEAPGAGVVAASAPGAGVAVESVDGAGAGAAGAGAGSVTGAGGGVTTAGAASSFFPQATSAAAAISEATRTDEDFFMESPLAMKVWTKKF
jgi:hypothetical protein